MATLEITTIIGCSNRCDYCPQDILLREYKGKKLMTLEDFKLILKNVPFNVQIDFTGFSEAFLNPESSEMMRHSINSGYRTVLYTTLSGFTDKDINVLRGLHFNDLVFHLYKGYNKEEFDKKAQKFEQFIHKPNRIAILDNNNGYINTPVWSRAGNTFGTMPLKGKYRCAFAGKLFDHNVVLPNGDVYICCMDYSLKHKIGNLFETHYDILDRNSLYILSEKEDSESICRKCEICQIL